MVRFTNPVIEIGQRTSATHSFTLVDVNERPLEPIDLTDADDVLLTMKHRTWGETVIDGESCEIADPDEGYVEHSFSGEDLRYFGVHYIQFEIEWSDADTTLVPPNSQDWTIFVGRRLPRDSPLQANRATFDELTVGDFHADSAVIDDFETGTFEAGSSTFRSVDAESVETGELHAEDGDIDRLSIGLFDDISTAIGGGFVWDEDDRLAVAIDEFGEVEGLTNPMTDDMELAGYDIRGPGRVGHPESPLASGHFELGEFDSAEIESAQIGDEWIVEATDGGNLAFRL